jgi:hypothetical protein
MKNNTSILLYFRGTVLALFAALSSAALAQQPVAGNTNQGVTARLVRKTKGTLLDTRGLPGGILSFEKGMTFTLKAQNLMGVTVESEGRIIRFEKRDIELVKTSLVQPSALAGAFVPGAIQITKATFGTVRGRRGNVKNQLTKLMPPGGMLQKPFSAQVSSTLFGKPEPTASGQINPDGAGGAQIVITPPAPQMLEVTYIFGGKIETVQVMEGSTLVLPKE